MPALRALVDAGHDVAVVISQPDRPAGRGRQVKPTPVRAAAQGLGLNHRQTEDINAAPVAEWFAGVELGIVAAFGQKLGPAVLAAVPRGFVNLHASLLPKYRGAAPFQWALIHGEAETGVTIFQLDEAWDRGPIWAQGKLAIPDDVTAAELHDELAKLAAELLLARLEQILAGKATPLPQAAVEATRAPKLSRADGYVDWAAPAVQVAGRIRGLWSWPGARAVFAARSGKREEVTLARAVVAERESKPDADCPPGTVRADGLIQTGQGSVRLIELQPAGRRVMGFEDFVRGRQVAPPDRFMRWEPR